MLKKKNIAMVMAAATVATSVAPVFALEAQNVDEKTLVSEVEKKLAVKYSDEKLGSVYKVEVTLQKGAVKDPVETITTVSKLKELLEKAEIEGKSITVDITDKGHKTEANKVVNTTGGKTYSKAELFAIAPNEAIKSVDKYNGTEKEGTTADNITSVVVTLKTGTELVLDETTAKLDLNRGLDAAGNKIDISKIAVGDTETGKRVVGFETEKYTKAELNAVVANAYIKTVEKYNANGIHADVTNVVDATNITKVVLTLMNGDKVTLNEDSDKLDLSKGLDKYGSETTVANDVVGFKAITAKLPAVKEAQLVCNGVVSQKLQFKLSDFKTDNGYTQAGKELIELLGDSNGNGSEANIVGVIKDGKRMSVRFSQANNLELKAVKDGGYQLVIDLMVAEDVKKLPEVPNVQLVISSAVQKDLVDLKGAIVAARANTTISLEQYAKLAGDNRFETAVAISRDAYKTSGTAGAVVLVGENAIVDGLASAPLARKADAPILLTKKDSIPENTLAEIKRVAAKGSEVYLVGGENTISKAVQTQLEKEIGAKVLRLAGQDRYETSLKIAKELGGTPAKAYVVGGDGLADAMSIAAVAANTATGTPILVSPATGLTKDAKDFLDETDSIKAVDVVGGTTKVSTQVLKDIVAIKNSTSSLDATPKALAATRIAGENRNDTNAKVIATFGAGSLAKVYVAKDGDAQLVDALAAAPYAGKNKAAIVLATNDLTKAQTDAIGAKKATSGQEVTQIGSGVASTVMQKVLKALGL